MSPAPHPPRTARRYAWIRVLVVLVTLLAAGTHIEAVEADSAPATAAQACDADYDVLTPAPRPPSLQAPRTVAQLRPGTQSGTEPPSPDVLLPAPVHVSPYSALYALRTVVLRC